MFEVDCLGSRPIMTPLGSIDLNASMTTLPLTDWIGSITTATARGLSCSNDCDPPSGSTVSGRLPGKTTQWQMTDLLGVDVDG